MDEPNLLSQALHEKFGLGKPKGIASYCLMPIESFSKADLIVIIGMIHESKESHIAERSRIIDLLLDMNPRDSRW